MTASLPRSYALLAQAVLIRAMRDGLEGYRETPGGQFWQDFIAAYNEAFPNHEQVANPFYEDVDHQGTGEVIDPRSCPLFMVLCRIVQKCGYFIDIDDAYALALRNRWARRNGYFECTCEFLREFTGDIWRRKIVSKVQGAYPEGSFIVVCRNSGKTEIEYRLLDECKKIPYYSTYIIYYREAE